MAPALMAPLEETLRQIFYKRRCLCISWLLEAGALSLHQIKMLLVLL